jgi:glycosyltransferase involved in cell wall biosynthesis
MKILVIAPTFATYTMFLNRVCKQLAANKWEVHWASSDFDFETRQTSTDGVQCHRINFPRGANPLDHWKAAKELRALVAEIQPDIIDVHFSAAMITTALAKKTSWPPILATVHGLRFPNQTGIRWLIESSAECWAARRMTKIGVLTDDDATALSRYVGSNVFRQPVYGIGCNLNIFDAARITAKQRAAAIEEANVQAGELVFVYIGRTIEFKGYALTMRAFLEAQSKIQNLRMIVCGSRDPMHRSGLSDEEERAVLNHPKISHVGWSNEVQKFLAVSEVTVFPSRREGMPVNLMESLAMGVPVITYDSRGCREVIEDESTGLVISKFEVADLRDAILRLAEDKRLRQRLSDTAIEQRDQFDRQLFVDERISRFEEMLSESANSTTNR